MGSHQYLLESHKAGQVVGPLIAYYFFFFINDIGYGIQSAGVYLEMTVFFIEK